jgi:hypothetical protein
MNDTKKAADLAKHMLDNGHFYNNSISLVRLREEARMAPEDFTSADNLLLQKGYTRGRREGTQDIRFLTAEGVDFAEAS